MCLYSVQLVEACAVFKASLDFKDTKANKKQNKLLLSITVDGIIMFATTKSINKIKKT